MKKNIFIIAISLMLGLGFSACNRVELTGTWIDPAMENSAATETGFTLAKDGTVTGINTGYLQYTHWEKVGDQLILQGTYNGTNPHDFIDTLWIDELTEDRLVLKDLGNYSATYQRKKD